MRGCKKVIRLARVVRGQCSYRFGGWWLFGRSSSDWQLGRWLRLMTCWQVGAIPFRPKCLQLLNAWQPWQVW